MNYKAITSLCFSLILSSTILGAARPAIMRNGQSSHEGQSAAQDSVIMVPVSLSGKPLSNENQQDRDFFLALLSVAANFGKVLLHKDDKTTVIQGVGDMINGIVQAAEIITKFQKRGISPAELQSMIAQALQDQAKQRMSHSANG